MNTFLKAIVLSVSTTVVAAPVMAAPQDQGHQQQYNQKVNQQKKANANHPTNGKNGYIQSNAHKNQSNAHKSLNPSRDWKVGQKVPSQYYGSGYKIDHSKYKKLSKPGANQQWIKVNSDYVLTNIVTHTILKIITG